MYVDSCLLCLNQCHFIRDVDLTTRARLRGKKSCNIFSEFPSWNSYIKNLFTEATKWNSDFPSSLKLSAIVTFLGFPSCGQSLKTSPTLVKLMNRARSDDVWSDCFLFFLCLSFGLRGEISGRLGDGARADLPLFNLAAALSGCACRSAADRVTLPQKNLWIFVCLSYLVKYFHVTQLVSAITSISV